MKKTSKQARGLWRSYDGNNGLPGPAIAVAQDRADYLWLATFGVGICRYDGEVFRTYGEEEGLADGPGVDDLCRCRRPRVGRHRSGRILF